MTLRACTNPVLDTRAAEASPLAGKVASQAARNQMTAVLVDKDFISCVFSALELVGITGELVNQDRVEGGGLIAGADRSVAAGMVAGSSLDPLDALEDTTDSVESHA